MMRGISEIKKLLPSLCSLANLGCGFGVAIAVVNGRFEAAPWLIILAMIFDAYDGRLARLLNSTSRLGGELDSFCDVTTFGMAPALLVGGLLSAGGEPLLGWAIGFLYITAAVYRLARFNVMQEEEDATHDYFAGLPSTGAGGMIAALVILDQHLAANSGSRVVMDLLPAVAVALALLMVTRWRFGNSVDFVTDRMSSPFCLFFILIGLALFILIPKIMPTVLFGGYILLALLGVLLERLHLKKATHKL
ncbi:MAG TPA: CDP-alcohol phosphatidyltransferase family protein [Candidatus Hypogeohydataceae bacterium YC38]